MQKIIFILVTLFITEISFGFIQDKHVLQNLSGVEFTTKVDLNFPPNDNLFLIEGKSEVFSRSTMVDYLSSFERKYKNLKNAPQFFICEMSLQIKDNKSDKIISRSDFPDIHINAGQRIKIKRAFYNLSIDSLESNPIAEDSKHTYHIQIECMRVTLKSTKDDDNPRYNQLVSVDRDSYPPGVALTIGIFKKMMSKIVDIDLGSIPFLTIR